MQKEPKRSNVRNDEDLELALKVVESGELSVDDEGKVWRHIYRGQPCNPPRRADKGSQKGHYLVVYFIVDGEHRRVLAHRLVATVKLGPIPSGWRVVHLNGNKSDNHPENLKITNDFTSRGTWQSESVPTEHLIELTKKRNAALEKAAAAVAAGSLIVDGEGRVWRRAEVDDKKGYLVLHVEGITIFAHRLVWRVLRGPLQDGLEINHLDGQPKNNHPDNLELVTHADNIRHSARVLGTIRPPVHLGENHPKAKLTEDDVRAIRKLLAEGVQQREIGRRFGVSQGPISQLARGMTWRHVT